MPQSVVTKTLVYKGKIYYPGPQNLSDEEAQALAQRGALENDPSVVSGVVSDGADGNGANAEQLEPIAARISATLGVERSSDETSVQFLERFAEQCEEAIERIHQRSDALERERDEAKAHREDAVAENHKLAAENDKLKAELEEVKAQLAAASQTTPETATTGDAKGDAKTEKGKAKS